MGRENEDFMDSAEYIFRNIPKVVLLDQLAEEATELAHACLKMSRVMKGYSTSPLDIEDCHDMLVEELGDLEACKIVLQLSEGDLMCESLKIASEKINRWARRIKAIKSDE